MRLGQLYQIALSATDINGAVEFYRDKIGLPLIKQFDEPVKLAFFDLGNVRLMIEEGDGSSVFYLSVQDLDATLDTFRTRAIEIAAEPRAIYVDTDGHFGPSGETEWMAFVKDPSGNLIGLVERRKDS